MRNHLTSVFLISLILGSSTLQAQVLSEVSSGSTFICPPCGCNADGQSFDKLGSCPACSMKLVNTENPSSGYDYENIYPIDVCEIIAASEESGDWVFLDVRTRKEYNGDLGHLPGAIHIHVDDLEQRIGELEKYRNRNILVYCLVSIRSVRASQFLADQGFTKVTNMLGGMSMWDGASLEDLPCKETGRVIE